jgi:hypothetical protein
LELERIQEQHLAHLQSLRGLCVFRTEVEEGREVMAHDPAVVAGTLVPELMSWWTMRDSLP